MTRLHLLGAILISILLFGCGGSGGGSGDEAVSRTAQFVAFRTQNPEAFYAVRDDGTASPVELSTDLTFTGVTTGKLSPDGTRVSMLGQGPLDAVRQLYVRNVDGSGLRRVSAVANAAAVIGSGTWSPDGSTLIYSADGDTPGITELYRVDQNGSNQEKVNGPLPVNERVSGAQWSPDGRYVSFRLRNDAAGRIVAIVIYDTVARSLTRVDVSADIETPKWAPDSGKLAYLRRDQITGEPAYQVLTVDPDGANHVISNGGLGAANWLSEYEWSPDGEYLAQLFRRREDKSPNVYAKDFVNIYHVATSDSIRVFNFYVNDNYPAIPSNTQICETRCTFAWSHLGTELAYLSDHDALGYLEIYSYNVATDTSRKVNHGLVDPLDVYSILGWTADDRYLVYQGGTSSDTTRITEFADPSSPDPATRIAQGGDVQRTFTWSPDHRRYFVAQQSATESYIEVRQTDSFGTARRVMSPSLSPADYVLGIVRLSPDGNYLVYEALDVMKGFVRELRATPANGGPARKISGNLEVSIFNGY